MEFKCYISITLITITGAIFFILNPPERFYYCYAAGITLSVFIFPMQHRIVEDD